ncbi:phenazine biosynthesis protein [Auricularia subglabra TFB-10046 SS5]|nr:phenazine biosynthesis protein [Auricularia subglabra TFB-10046 SS5]
MSLLELEYTIVDAFTSSVFAGNPAAVIVLPPGSEAARLPDATLQLIAREFNLSETAYISPTETEGVYGLRWFTPTSEVKLCGHATLASAHFLLSQSAKGARVSFDTRWSGRLEVAKHDNGMIEMEFPAGVPEPVSSDERDNVLTIVRGALGVTAKDLRAEFVGAVPGTSFSTYLLIHLDDEFDLAAATVNAGSLTALAPRGIIILTNRCAPSGKHFASRVFGPLFGVPEDPVCGSAHCLLTTYWSQKLGERTLAAKQISARTGDLEVEWVPERALVKLRGNAVVAAKGVIYVPRD